MRNLLRHILIVVLFGTPASAGVSDQRVLELKHMVLQDCGSCHGLTRKGGLGGPLTYEALKDTPPEVLESTILNGIPGTAMPRWRPLLSEDDARWIVKYLLKEEPQ
ncbi:MAG: cytochrome c [Amylibacter sp.]|nr:cytochrome c [Amylibacter sp.]